MIKVDKQIRRTMGRNLLVHLPTIFKEGQAMAKYKRKSFSPHIYQDWIHLFRQCSQEQRAELLLAITDYPNYEPSADVPIWDFIKSQLEAQYQSMENKSQQMSTNRVKEKQKSTEVDQSRPLSTEVNKSTQIEIETRIETGTETKEKELSSDNSKKKVCEETVFNAGFQNWKFDPALLKVAKKHWTNESIRAIERDFSCNEYNTETNIEDLLERYPSDKVPFKILGEKKSIPLTKKQWEWFQEQSITPAVKVKAIDILENYALSHPDKFKKFTDPSLIMGRKSGWAYVEAFKEPYRFENQEELIAELKRVGLR